MFLSRRMWRQFLPIAVALTLMSALLYFVMQQNYRLNANDPQVQISQDVKNALNNGENPESLVSPGNQIDIANSLSSFLVVYDNNKKAVVSSAHLNNAIPTPPPSVFDYLKDNNSTRVTWQPDKNVRVAAVLEKYKNGYVLVGRSLREVEDRINLLGLQVLIGWLASLILVYGTVLIVGQRRKVEPSVSDRKEKGRLEPSREPKLRK